MDGRQTGCYPDTLVLYRTRPIWSVRQISEACGERPIQLFEGSRAYANSMVWPW